MSNSINAILQRNAQISSLLNVAYLNDPLKTIDSSMVAADLDGTANTTPTLQASYELQQATATANPSLTGQSQLVAVPVAVAGNPSALAQLNSWANQHADFTQGLNGAMTLLRGLQTNNKISITTGAFDLAKSFASGGAGRPHGAWLVGRDAWEASNDAAYRQAA